MYSGYVFRSPNIRSQIIARGQGAVRANIGQQDLYKILTILPSIEEQSAIATVLSDMDGAIAALEARRAKTQAIKQGMMQELLTGKTRLINNE
jgi:type I restriction enzyme, S subunit